MFSILYTVRFNTVMPEVRRLLTNGKQRKTDIRLKIPQTDKSLRDYRALNQNWSYQPTLAGRAVTKTCFVHSKIM